MHKRMTVLFVLSMLLLMGAQCSPTGDPVAKEIPSGTYIGTVGGQSQLLDANGAALQSSSTQSTITLVVDSTNKPISMNISASSAAPSQTLTTFTVGQSQRFQYSYNDAQNGSVNVDYTARVIRSEYGASAYVLEYEFTGSQTTAYGVTSMFGNNQYQLYNQTGGVWVIRNQTSTLTPPGGQGSVKSTIFETGVLPKAS